MVMNPVTTQAAMSSAGELTSRAISAETMKMPEPIMEPMTRVVALVRPRPLIHSLSPAIDTVFVSFAKRPRLVVRVSKLQRENVRVVRAFRPALSAIDQNRLYRLLKKEPK